MVDHISIIKEEGTLYHTLENPVMNNLYLDVRGRCVDYSWLRLWPVSMTIIMILEERDIKKILRSRKEGRQ